MNEATAGRVLRFKASNKGEFMFRAAIITAVCFCASTAQAATSTALPAGGDWSNPATWDSASVPTATDDVILDAFSGSVTVDAAADCLTLNATGFAGTLAVNAPLRIATSATPATGRILTLGGGMSLTYVAGLGSLELNRDANGFRSTLTGLHELPDTLANRVELDGDLYANSLDVAFALRTNDYDVTTAQAVDVWWGDLTLGSSLVTCGEWLGTYASSVDYGTSTIRVTGIGGYGRFLDGKRSYHNIEVAAGIECRFGSATVIPTLKMNSLTVVGGGDTILTFQRKAYIRFRGDSIIPSGAPGTLVTLRCHHPDGKWYLWCLDQLNADYVAVNGSIPEWSNVYAGPNSIDLGGNGEGWHF